MTVHSIYKIALIGALTLTCSSAARADRIFGYTQAQVSSSNPFGSDHKQDLFEYSNPALMVTPQSFSTSAAFAGGAANAAATASLGTIRASGTSSYEHDNSNSAAQNGTFVRVEDTVTVMGTDPLGGVTFTLGVSGSNSGFIACCDSSFWYAYFDFRAIQNGNNIVNLSWNEDSSNSPVVNNSTTVYGLHVGDQILLSYGVNLSTYASSLSGFSTSIFADYSNTAHFYADAGPGTSIVSASSFNYSSAAVPEPSTGILLAGVLLAGAFIRRRRSA